MTKRLILFRHGKSDWEANFQADHERPVAKRGIKAARVMGKLLAIAHQCPDSVVTSSAVRAKTTVELAAQAGDWQCPIRVTSDLYEAQPAAVLAIIQAEPDTTKTLLLAGHEPTWSTVSSRFIGGGSLDFPTAGMVCIEFDVSHWQQVCFGCGTLNWMLHPKFFTEGEFGLV